LPAVILLFQVKQPLVEESVHPQAVRDQLRRIRAQAKHILLAGRHGLGETDVTKLRVNRVSV
jgi:transcriptional regulator with AAA-type ATPase domain